ncbi:Coniferyl alcohol acyltransferase [Linum grandiflorum]
MVKAATLTSLYQTLPLSNLDLLSGRFPVTYLYLYPNLQNIHLPTILTSLRRSLAKTLHYYYPFSGRIVTNPATSEPEIICNNQGVLFVEASANVTLKRVNFYDLNKLVMQGKLVSLSPDIPFQVQVTGYTCGGVSMTFTFDHALDILNMPTPMGTMVKRLYHIDAGCINRLQQLASPNGKRTKVEALSAYIWKLMAKSIDGRKYKECKMGWLVDGRGRIGGRLKGNTMSNYIGNVLSVAIGEANVDELEGDSLAKVAGKVHEAISEATREEHFLEVMDWIECHRPGLMMARIVLGGGGGPAVVVSSGRRFPVGELEFGFGRAVLGTVSSTIDKIGVGYFNQRESGKNDGCWTVSAILWPQLVEALESDSVFHPISVAQHLLL